MAGGDHSDRRNLGEVARRSSVETLDCVCKANDRQIRAADRDNGYAAIALGLKAMQETYGEDAVDGRKIRIEESAGGGLFLEVLRHV